MQCNSVLLGRLEGVSWRWEFVEEQQLRELGDKKQDSLLTDLLAHSLMLNRDENSPIKTRGCVCLFLCFVLHTTRARSEITFKVLCKTCFLIRFMWSPRQRLKSHAFKFYYYFLSSPEDMPIDFLERGGRKRERERNMDVREKLQ